MATASKRWQEPTQRVRLRGSAIPEPPENYVTAVTMCARVWFRLGERSSNWSAQIDISRATNHIFRLITF